MLKSKTVLSVLLTFLIFGLAGLVVLAQDRDVQSEKVQYPDVDMAIGFSLPTVGWIHYNETGRIKTLSGFNAGIGYSWREYFGEGVELNEFNGYWGWGTVVLFVPYIEVGTTYAAPISGGTQILALEIGVVYIFPRLGFSIWF